MKYFITIISTLLLLACTTEKKKSFKEYKGEVFGSTFNIKYESHLDLNKQIDSIFTQFNQSVSTYLKNSEVSKFNESKDGIVSYDEDFKNMVLFSRRMNIRTNGYFNPAVESISKSKGEELAAKSENGGLSRDELSKLRNLISIYRIKVKDSLITKPNPELKLSFNSITGYCNDIVVDFFDQKKLENYLVEIGGEISANGVNDKGTSWIVGIDDPKDPERLKESPKLKLRLENRSLATSGNYRKFYENEKGEKFAHTIDPTTGSTKPSDILSISVLSDSGAKADALATAILAMGAEKAYKFLDENTDVLAYLVFIRNDKVYEESFNGFGSYIVTD